SYASVIGSVITEGGLDECGSGRDWQTRPRGRLQHVLGEHDERRRLVPFAPHGLAPWGEFPNAPARDSTFSAMRSSAVAKGPVGQSALRMTSTGAPSCKAIDARTPQSRAFKSALELLL